MRIHQPTQTFVNSAWRVSERALHYARGRGRREATGPAFPPENGPGLRTRDGSSLHRASGPEPEALLLSSLEAAVHCRYGHVRLTVTFDPGVGYVHRTTIEAITPDDGARGT
jgi:hypothetical protein